MLRNIFAISDTHFNHKNILGFENDAGQLIRTFGCVEEMNEVMVQNWNAVVKDHDIVYHLGDVYFGPECEAQVLLGRLRGRKRLVLGNHDTGKDKVLHMNFQKISVWRLFPEFSMLLTHVPVHPSTLGHRGVERNGHGHIHQNVVKDRVMNSELRPDSRYVNFCVEHTGYTPVALEAVK